MQREDGGGPRALAPARATTAGASSPWKRSGALRPSLAPRAALLDRMLGAREPVIGVTAPPGYGKSTLLAAWAERRGARVAWVSCDQIGDDPGSLWPAVMTALDTSVPRPPSRPSPRPGPDHGVADPTGRDGGRTDTVVLDQVEALSSRESRRSVAALASTLPQGWTLAMASREELPLPTARMRVERRLLEIGVDDLTMSQPEAARLIKAVGVEEPDARIARRPSPRAGRRRSTWLRWRSGTGRTRRPGASLATTG